MRNSVILILLACMFAGCTENKDNKIGYVLNTELFEGYNGTKDKRKILTKSEERLKFNLDSLAAEIQVLQKAKDESSKKKGEWMSVRYQQLSREYSEKFDEEQQQYTEELWKQINQYVGEYGKANDYDMIYGASGNGAIMYADSSFNVTKEVLEFINQKYEGK